MPNIKPIERDGPSPFTEHNGKFYQNIWDSTSLGIFKDCPKKYEMVMLQGWTPKKRSFHLTFGIWFHEALEEYDFALLAGKSPREALEEVLWNCLKKTGTRDENDTFIPWESGDKHKTRENLLRAVAWHLTQFEHDQWKTIELASGKPAVELSFKMELGLDDPTGAPYILSGHLDKLAQSPGDGIWAMDHKTTKSSLGDYYFAQFNPNNQIYLYANAARVVYSVPIRGVIINAVQIAQGFIRSSRWPIHLTKSQLDNWMVETSYWLQQAELCTKLAFFPRNDKSCFLCDFKSICSKDEAVQETFLAADFERNPWNPAQSRNT